MNHEQLLHDYVDGVLDYQGEASLFAELHVNEPLRGELRSLLLIRRGVNHDARAFMPPVDSTTAIFDRLGFGGSSRRAAGAIAWGGWRGYTQGLIGGVIGAVVMAILLTFGDRIGGEQHGASSQSNAPASLSAGSSAGEAGTRSPSRDNSSRSAAADGAASERLVSQGDRSAGRERASSMESSSNASSSSSVPPSSSARSSSIVQSQRRGTSMIAERPIAAVDPQQPAEPRQTESIPSDAGHIPPTFSAPLMSDDSSTSRAIETMRDDREEPASTEQLAMPEEWRNESLEESIAWYLPIGVEYRAIMSSNFFDVPDELRNDGSLLMNNGAFSVYYELNDRRRIGIEVGREEFFQKYDEVLPSGDRVRHEQNPALFWGGISYREQLNKSVGLNPFAQGTVGFTQVGPMARVLLGAHYEILPALRLVGAMEGSIAAYEFGSTWYVSPNYGFTYGASINF